MAPRKLLVLLCEDMKTYSEAFCDKQHRYFDIEICADVHKLRDKILELEDNRRFPDILLLDLFSRKDTVKDDTYFERERAELDAKIHKVLEQIKQIGSDARKILRPTGLSALRRIRAQYPEHTLPILLYSRLGPYILNHSEYRTAQEYNSDFLLKLLNHDEQRFRINDFFEKWHSQENPIPLEISRKLSTLNKSLSGKIRKLLKQKQYELSIIEGCQFITQNLQSIAGSKNEGGALATELKNLLIEALKEHADRCGIEEKSRRYYHYKQRVESTCEMYKSTWVLMRNRAVHAKTYPWPSRNNWADAEMCIASVRIISEEVEAMLAEFGLITWI